MKVIASLLAASLAVASAQQPGNLSPEEHPAFPIQTCTKAGCKTEATQLVMDMAWRWVHTSDPSAASCVSGSSFTCGDAATCAQKCVLEGITASGYNTTYGVTTSGNEVSMNYNAKQSGSRMYITTPTGDKYRMFKLLNQELTFDIDTSTLQCGMNGALYLISMPEDGGASFAGNKAGAKYGTGYCDAQCPTGQNFVNGGANTAHAGQCCAEMDIWEGNRAATVFTPHPATKPGLYTCTTDCNDITDKNGCGFNSYANGEHSFYGYGSGFTLDSSKKITVVTQFITDTNTAAGNLIDIRRIWVQNGKVIYNSNKTGTTVNSITDAYCASAGASAFTQKGALKAMGKELGNGMVLSVATWTGSDGLMTWLDAGNNGPCPSNDSGGLAPLQTPGSTLKFSNLRVGDIGTTFSSGSAPVTTAPTAKPTTTTAPTPKPTATTAPTVKPATTKPAGAVVQQWGQCGGQGYTGSTTCVAGTTCVVQSQWYSQCK